MIALIFLFLSSHSFAATRGYDLQMDLAIKGRETIHPHIVVAEGVPQTIIQPLDKSGEKSYLEVIANERPVRNKRAILVKFIIGFIEPDGKKRVVSASQILTLEKQKRSVSV